MNMRSFWWLALAFTLLWIWLQWTQFQHAKSQPAAIQQTQQASDNGVPTANQIAASNEVPATKGGEVPATKIALASGQRVKVKTDVYNITLDTDGGDIRDVYLLKYAAQDDHSKPFKLMSDKGNLFYIAQNGIASQANAKLPAPNHKSVYQVAKTDYEMTGKTLTVPMVWEKDGIKVTKTYTFEKGSYLIKVDYKVENLSGEPWSGSLYSQIKRSSNDPYHNRMMYTYTGPVLYDGNAENKYNKHKFEDLKTQPVNGQTATGGWGAMIQHYFISAVIPNQKAQNSFYAKSLGHDDYSVGVVEPMVQIKPGQSADLSTQLYVGPIIQDKLKSIAPGLELTVDYGVLTIIAKPIFWLLEKIHSVVGNWGWSIIFLTILIKLLFYKLSETSYRSMARLKKFQPKMQQLKENYGDDKVIFQQKLMALYKEEKINPLGGCLPILVQMPVFIALYWVLLYSAEMRQAPWMLWIQDLSAKDPYYILPVLMGISMWVQQKLNPSAMMDEMQQKVMKLLPFIFTVFFMFFPAGLVLYWVVNNVLSVTQQWYITKKIAAGEEK
ncbi:membrane protein insertase YidC [Hydrogenovibrio marinus]|uniref:Membrane protein insertase YidC n=1 Tax=Hydrogenovibrio marinus TaxID=28885 RepID=A0A067A169_HYDMR|nr:membrane protein insertase YidC [Hydrogenovibrio marinus]KDN96100.1 membrane protein insertase [Hydrogenovibrio marinus]BBN60724.1 membrane protein insertase YidC [Hydrogenovibrio marinus]